jgi:poly(3-hydroxyalkanoate) synthetase
VGRLHRQVGGFLSLTPGPVVTARSREALVKRNGQRITAWPFRDFSTAAEGIPTLICAPFALHHSTIADFAPDHSLVAALQDAGIRCVFLTNWRSARSDMRFLSIDNYLADLNTLVDELGGRVNLVGLCQGGWP